MPQYEFVQYCEGEFANLDSMEQLREQGIRQYIEMTGAMDPSVSTSVLRTRNDKILGDLDTNSQKFWDTLDASMQYRTLVRRISELREHYNNARANGVDDGVLPEKLMSDLQQAFEQYQKYGQRTNGNQSLLQNITEFEGKIQSSRIIAGMCDLPSPFVANSTGSQLDLYSTYSSRLDAIKTSRAVNGQEHSVSTRANVLRNYKDYMAFMRQKDENGITNRYKISEFENNLVLKDFFKSSIQGKGIPNYDISKLSSFDEIMSAQPITMDDINKVMDERTAISRPKPRAPHNIGEGTRWTDYLDPALVPGNFDKKGAKKWTDYIDPALVPDGPPNLSNKGDEMDR